MGILWRYNQQRKKNNHVFHKACLTYITNFYDKECINNGKLPINNNIIWTDQCPTQYRCRKNILNIATSSSKTVFPNNSVRVHKFGAKYRFKGSWDAFGKHIKQRIHNSELQYERIPDAFHCYKVLKHKMEDTEREKLMNKKFRDYEETQDVRILNNTTFKCLCTFIGYATENHEEYI